MTYRYLCCICQEAELSFTKTYSDEHEDECMNGIVESKESREFREEFTLSELSYALIGIFMLKTAVLVCVLDIYIYATAYLSGQFI